MKQIKVSRKKTIKIQTTKEGAHYYISKGVKYWKRKDLTTIGNLQYAAYPAVADVISISDVHIFRQLDIQRWEGAIYLPEIAIKAYILARDKRSFKSACYGWNAKAVAFIAEHFDMQVKERKSQPGPKKSKIREIPQTLAQKLFNAKHRLRKAQAKLEVEADICVALASQIPSKQISINVGNNNTNTNIEVKA